MTGSQLKAVLDASALLAWMLDERGADAVSQTIRAGVATTPASAMVEALYVAKGKGQRLAIDVLQQSLTDLGLRIEPITDEDTVRAAELIAGSRKRERDTWLSLGDGLCIAVAERLGLMLVGDDRDWALEDLRVEFGTFR